LAILEAFLDPAAVAMEGSKGALYDSLGKILRMGANYMDMLDMSSQLKRLLNLLTG
jgi:hypothetical protein